MTPVLWQILVLICECCPSFEPNAPYTTRAVESGWGESLHGVSMLAATDVDTVEVGDEMRFEFFFRFDPFEWNGHATVLDRVEEKCWLTFKEIGGAGEYQRRPYREGMPWMVGDEGDAVDLMNDPPEPRSGLFMLLSEEGEQITAGDYVVHATYQNTGIMERAARRGCRTREYPNPELVWSGSIQTPTFRVHVNPKVADTTRCELPTRIEIDPEGNGQLMFRWAADSFEPAVLVSRPGYHLGWRTRGSKHVGDQVVAVNDIQSGGATKAIDPRQIYGFVLGESLGGLPKPERGASGLTGSEIREALAGGKKLRVVFDVTIFETSIPSMHMWRPERGDYRVLREYQVVQTWP